VRLAPVSVLITTFRRPASLRMTLDSLAWQQPRPARLDVVIVDNDPAHSARPTATTWRAPAGWTLRYVTEPRPSKARALNRGLGLVRHDLIVFLDDDVVLWPHALRAYRRAAARWPRAVAFGGRLHSVCPQGIPRGLATEGRHRLYLGWPTHDLGERPRAYRAGENPMGGSRLIRRAGLLDGGFSTRFVDQGLTNSGDDMWLGRRWHEEGQTAMYLPDAMAWHVVEPAALAWPRLWRRYVNHGRYQVLAQPAGEWARYRYLLRALPAEVVAAVSHHLRGDGTAGRYHWLEVARQLGMVAQLARSGP
jgi:GT2 family glycosyltransferase